jgi:hypothetical protein
MLTWDNSLASDAQAWADSLEAEQDDGCEWYHASNTGQGENLYWNWSSQPTTPADTPEDVLVGWWDDEETSAIAGATTGIGHFTQAAWYGTTTVGCGSFSNPDSVTDPKYPNGVCHVQVCRYYVPGNCGIGDYSNWKVLTLEGSTACG